MKKVLFGTTNNAKLKRLKVILSDLNIDLVCLNDVNIKIDINEDGINPLENAIKKAKTYYKLSKMPTFSIDSGLYIDSFPDKFQPGNYVRRVGEKVLNDEEMLEYYINMLKRYGGDSKGKWITSIAFIINDDIIISKTFIDETYFTTNKSEILIVDEPLNSIQIDLLLNKYKSEITFEERREKQGKLDNDIYDFFKENIDKI